MNQKQVSNLQSETQELLFGAAKVHQYNLF